MSIGKTISMSVLSIIENGNSLLTSNAELLNQSSKNLTGLLTDSTSICLTSTSQKVQEYSSTVKESAEEAMNCTKESLNKKAFEVKEGVEEIVVETTLKMSLHIKQKRKKMGLAVANAMVGEEISIVKKQDKLKQALQLKKILNQVQGDKEFFHYIIAVTALGLAVAYSDGEIDEKEEEEINATVAGLASTNYPEHVKKNIINLLENPPTFKEAMVYMEYVNPTQYVDIRNMMIDVMLADGIEDEKERAYIKAFDKSIKDVHYIGDKDDKSNNNLHDIIK